MATEEDKKSPNFQAILNGVIKLSKEVGDWIHSQEQNESLKVSEKSFNNLVSFVDKTAESMFIKGLNTVLPGVSILGEETGKHIVRSDYTWVIDPLDGTTNFLHKVPFYCTSVALLHHKEPILGVIYHPHLKDVFYATKGYGAFKNQKEITVSDSTKLLESLIATGFPYDGFDQLDEYFNIIRELVKVTRGVRRIGAAALDLCYVAQGTFDSFYESNLAPWDVAAGSIIVKEAGGKVTDYKNESNYIHGKEIVAGNKNIHSELLNLIQQFIR